MSQVRIKLRSGDREIEIDGPRADVNELLEKWWTSTPVGRTAPAGRTAARRNPKPPTDKANGDDDTSAFDPSAVANELKENENYPLIEKKVFHQKAGHWEKTALILWITGESLTSGEIFKVLTELHVKTTHSRVSEALTNNTGRLIRDTKGSKARSRLSGHAKTEFEKWLLSPAPTKGSDAA
jgi:hypothetical protein